MSVSKKHYERMAAEINRLRTEATQPGACYNDYPNEKTRVVARMAYTEALFDAARTFADIAESESPKFDRERFMSACGFTN